MSDQAPPEKRLFYTVDEAAAFLGIAPKTIRNWVSKRTITHRKHGRNVVFTMSDLLAWSESQIVPAEKHLDRRGKGEEKYLSSLKRRGSQASKRKNGGDDGD